MRASLIELSESFIKNRDIIKQGFAWENSYLYPICAAIFTDKRKTADVERMKECRDILKSKNGIFSDFRGISMLPMMAMMASSDDPEKKLDRAMKVSQALKEHFWSSQFLPVASMIIADTVDEENYVKIAERTRKIYDLMKSEHPFLTSSEDSVFAAMLALSELSNQQIVGETEKCYNILKNEFYSANAVQSLSHVLALSQGSAEGKCRATLALFNDLKEKKHKYGTDYTLATLGVAAMLPTDIKYVMNDIIDVDDFLSGQKGYGFFGLDSKQRIMHAAMIVVSDYIGQSELMSGAVIESTLSLVAAQQAAMCAAIAASSAANAST
ncbi:MAG: DUF4003 domain-containing protein [Clostridia bacterium]|nr:DUF4003 domain-containing protein [Clostridia bacterium]